MQIRGWQIMTHQPNPATPICLNIVYRYFNATMAELSCDEDDMLPKAKLFITWPLTKKNLLTLDPDQWFSQLCSLKLDSVKVHQGFRWRVKRGW